MIKDWSKLLELIPKELILDTEGRPVQRGADINMIIEVMYREYGFRVDMIQHGEQGCTPIYNKWELYFINDKYALQLCHKLLLLNPLKNLHVYHRLLKKQYLTFLEPSNCYQPWL